MSDNLTVPYKENIVRDMPNFNPHATSNNTPTTDYPSASNLQITQSVSNINHNYKPRNQLSFDDRRQLSESRKKYKKIQRAIKVARFGGWTTGLFAVLSFPFAFFSFQALFIFIGLSVVAYHEFAGAKLLGRLNPEATIRLGNNQIAFAAILVVYCLWSIYSALHSPSSLASMIGNTAGDSGGSNSINSSVGDQYSSIIGSFDDLARTITIYSYGSIACLSIVFQGLTARYYFTRRKYLLTYIHETPAWIINLQQDGLF